MTFKITKNKIMVWSVFILLLIYSPLLFLAILVIVGFKNTVDKILNRGKQ